MRSRNDQQSSRSAQRRPAIAFIAAAFALLVAFPAGAVAAEYAQKTSFCSPGTGAGQCETGSKGVAVDQSNGNVFFVDANNGRVVSFGEDGTFLRSFGLDVIPGGAEGTGIVTNGSDEITTVVTTKKAFVVGQTISGTGIAPGTKIATVTTGVGAAAKLKISQPATAAATGGVTAISTAEGAGNVARNELQTVTVPGTASGNFKLAFATTMPTASGPTADIAVGSPASGAGSVQAALEALSNVGAGNVSVTGPAGGPYVIEFTGTRFSDTNVNQITVNTQPTGGSLTIATTREGTAPEACTTASTCQKGTSGTGAGPLGAIGAGGRSVAVDSETHIVYVVSNPGVKYYDGMTGAFLGEFNATTGANAAGTSMPPSPVAPQNFAALTGIAVDSSGAQNYLYLAATASLIDKFAVPVVTGGTVTTQASYLCQISGKEVASATECAGAASKNGAFDGITFTSKKGGTLAVDSAGNVIVGEGTITSGTEQVSRNTVSIFSSAGTFVKQCTITRPEAVAAGADGRVYVAVEHKSTANEGGIRVEEYETDTCAPVSEFGADVIGNETSVGGSLGIAVSFGGGGLVQDVLVGDSSTNAKVWGFAQQVKLKVQKSGNGAGTLVSDPAGLICGATECEGTFDAGAEVTLTAAPDANTQPAQWADCDSEPAENECEVALDSLETTVGVAFELEERELTVAKAGDGSGTVTSAPAGIECGATCSAVFTHGTSVTLKGASDSGSKAVAWSGCGSVNGANECVVSMTAAKAVTATFDKAPTDGGGNGGGGGGNDGGGSTPPPPPPVTCKVPKLVGKTLAQAKAALRAASCTLGKVTKPRKAKGKLIVKSSQPGAGAVRAERAKVNLKLGPKPKKKAQKKRGARRSAAALAG